MLYHAPVVDRAEHSTQAFKRVLLSVVSIAGLLWLGYDRSKQQNGLVVRKVAPSGDGVVVECQVLNTLACRESIGRHDGSG